MPKKELPPPDGFHFRWGDIEINISGRLALQCVAGLAALAALTRWARLW
jgi:hypothetical protein